MIICILSEKGDGNEPKIYNKNELTKVFKERFGVEFDWKSCHNQEELNKLIDKQLFDTQRMICWDKTEQRRKVNLTQSVCLNLSELE